MLHIKCLLLLFLVIVLDGCVTRPELTRQQWLEMTSHTFKNTTVHDVLEAGDKVLKLADSSDVTVHHLQDKMVGSRRYNFYAVFAAVFGSFNFDLTAKQEGSDVITYLLIGHSSQPIIPTATYTPGTTASGIGVGASPGIVIGAPIPFSEPYSLFFSRIEALLFGATWMTCAETKIDKPTGTLDSMCFLADDTIPEGASISEYTHKQLAAEKANASKDVMAYPF